jgi:adenylate cyclase
MKIRFSLRLKLVLLSMVLAILPLVIAGGTIIRIAQDELKSTVNNDLSQTSAAMAGRIDDVFENAWLAPLRLIRNGIENDGLGTPEKIALMTSGLQDLPDVMALQLTGRGIDTPVLIGKDGFVAKLDAAGLDGRERLRLPPERLEAFQGSDRVAMLPPEVIPATGDRLITLVIPLETPLLGRDAVFSARISLERLQQIVSNHPFQNVGRIFLVDRAGQALFNDDATTELGIVTAATEMLDSPVRSTVTYPYTRPDGVEMLGAVAFPKRFDWGVVTEQPRDDAYLIIRQMLASLLFWMVLGLGLAIGAGVVFAFRLSQPILKIGSVTEQISKGNLNVRVEGVRSKDEIGDLARRVNEMIQGLLERLHLEKFVSTGTMDAVKTAGERGIKLGGERREVTVFFSDIRGFTAFSEKVEPEVVVDMLNTFLRRQAYLVNEYQGDIDKFVGDELVAVFQGDHMVENAIRCAVEIQAEMERIRAEKQEWDIGIGIGINTGVVVMGAMGSEDRMDYTMLGDNVNLGARLCSKAGPGQILLSHATYERVDPENTPVDLNRLEPIQVKGKAQPIQIYEAKAPQVAPVP